MPGLKRGVFSRASFTVVPVTDNDPWNASLLVVSRGCGDGAKLSCKSVLNFVGFTVGGVDGTNQHIIGNVVEMAAVL